MSHYDVHGIATPKGEPVLYTDHTKTVNASRVKHIDDSHPGHPAKLHVHHSTGGNSHVEGAVFDPTGETPHSWRHLPIVPLGED